MTAFNLLTTLGLPSAAGLISILPAKLFGFSPTGPVANPLASLKSAFVTLHTFYPLN